MSEEHAAATEAEPTFDLDFDYDEEPLGDSDFAALLGSIFGEMPEPDAEVQARYDALSPEVNDVLDTLDEQIQSDEGHNVTVELTPVLQRRLLIGMGMYAFKTGLQQEQSGEALDVVEAVLNALR
jgi:hypothetical protein